MSYEKKYNDNYGLFKNNCYEIKSYLCNKKYTYSKLKKHTYIVSTNLAMFFFVNKIRE